MMLALFIGSLMTIRAYVPPSPGNLAEAEPEVVTHHMYYTTYDIYRFTPIGAVCFWLAVAMVIFLLLRKRKK